MKNKILEMLENKGSYVSGEDISNALSISRTAVWKHINALRQQGYVIESKTNKGYCLTKSPDRFNEKKFFDSLNTSYMGKNFSALESVDSTNEELKRLARDGAVSGTVVIAEEQTAGKGRIGRSWSSAKYEGVYFSFLTRPRISPVQVPVVTILTGLCVCLAIRKTTNAKAMIKWPNDIIIENKKICGILTEMTAEAEQINFVVTGVGINVNNRSFPDEVGRKATSLYIETGDKQSREIILSEILFLVEKVFTEYFELGELSYIDEYKKYCASIGRDVLVDGKAGHAVDIEKNGELVVEFADGTRQHVFSGEVVVQGIY